MAIRFLLLILAFVALALLAPMPARASPQTIWRTVANAELIVIGTIHLPRDGNGRVMLKMEDYNDIIVEPLEILKGLPQKRFVLRTYYTGKTYEVSNDALRVLDGKRAVLLLRSGSNGRGGQSWYFAGNETSLWEATGAAVQDVKSEIARQNTVLHNWRPRAGKTMTTLVAYWIGAIAGGREPNAPYRLEMMGMPAVAAIIDQMANYKPYPYSEIVLKNPPGFFESTRHYGPDKIVDALATILSQVTHESFGFIYNGDEPDSFRALTVNGWRIYQDVQLNHKDWLSK